MQSYEKKYTVAIVIVKILHLIFCSFFTHQEDEEKKKLKIIVCEEKRNN